MKNKFFYILCLLIFSFSACNFDIKDKSSQDNQKKITVRGTCKISEFIPSKMIYKNFKNSRTVVPALDDINDFQYVITFKNGEETKTVDAIVIENQIIFEVSLALGTWTIQAIGKTPEGKVPLQSEEITQEILSKDVFIELSLKPIYGTEKGTVYFSFGNLSNSINKMKCVYTKDSESNDKEITNFAEPFILELDSGVYDFRFIFYNDNEIVFTFSEVVNVFDGLKTDSWIGSAKYINSDGKIEINDEHINEFKLSTFYVDAENGDDDNNGSFFAPIKTLHAAIEKTISNNEILESSSEIPYKIFLQTDILRENDFVGNSITPNGERSARNVYFTINPQESNKELWVEISSVDGNQKEINALYNETTPGSVFYVNNVNVKLNNVKITGGYLESNNGAGIYIDETAKIDIINCEITGNKIQNANGAGVYVSSGATINVGGLVKITGNKTKVGTEEKENNVYLCDEAKLSFISGLSEGSEIGITTQTTPLHWNPVEIASKSSFDTVMPDKNINSYVKSDVSGYVINETDENYGLFPSGGNFEIGEIPNLQIFLNETSSSENIILSESLEVSITAMLDGKIIDFDSSDLPKITVYNHGSLAQSIISGNTYTIPDDWPKDEIYQFVVSVVYEGITYTETFTVRFENELEAE